jgi:hypothetical protein
LTVQILQWRAAAMQEAGVLKGSEREIVPLEIPRNSGCFSSLALAMMVKVQLVDLSQIVIGAKPSVTPYSTHPIPL